MRWLTDLKKAASSVGDTILDVGRDVVRDVPVVGGLLGQESSATQAANQQTESLNDARAYQEKMYGETQKYLDPYLQMGQNAMLGTLNEDGMRSGGLYNDINAGKYQQDDFNYSGNKPEFSHDGQTMGAFNYGGPQMSSNVDYSGSQPDQFSYSGAGQQGNLGYTVGPVDRSIESYMKDDPSLAYQQEMMEKAINRQGAAKGRWGGGATGREMMRETAGLLSQDYSNRFNRASQERMADVGTEQNRYSRSLTNLGLQNQAEQSQYNRATGQYGMDVARERDAYGRALTDTNMGNASAQNMYDQAQYGYQTGVNDEQNIYNRAVQQYGMQSDRESDLYNRAVQQYGMQGQNLQNALNQQTSMANYGPQMATTLSNAALGQGSALSDLAIQQGNINANATLANGNQTAKLLEMSGSIAKLASKESKSAAKE